MTPLSCGACLLRPWRTDDLSSLVRHANNRKIWLAVRDRFPHPYTDDDGRVWLDHVCADDPPSVLAVDVDGEAVGGVGFVAGVDVNRHAAELGFWLGEAYWHRGIMTAAIRAVLPWACDTHGFERVFAEVFENNPASMRVLEKCGFVREGRLRRHAKKDGEYLDQLVFGWLKGS